MIQARIDNYYKLRKMVIVLVVAGIVMLIIAGTLIAGFLRKRKKKIANAAKNISKAAIEAVRDIGSQNEIFYHGEEDRHGDPVTPEEDSDKTKEDLDEEKNGPEDQKNP